MMGQNHQQHRIALHLIPVTTWPVIDGQRKVGVDSACARQRTIGVNRVGLGLVGVEVAVHDEQARCG